MDDRIWWLPGPRSFVREALRNCENRRHTALVLPQARVADEEFGAGLVAALASGAPQSRDVRRLYPSDDAPTLLDAFASELVYDDPPPTVADLLAHGDVDGLIAVVLASDIADPLRAELPDLLRRFAVARPSSLAIVVVGCRRDLPRFAGGADTDPRFASVWWWNRIARWDVAAHLVTDGPPAGPRVLEDVRVETMVEVARWDLGLAEFLDEKWTGDPEDLPLLVAGWRLGLDVDPSGLDGGGGPRPTDDVVELWDDGVLDGWHDSCSVAVWASIEQTQSIRRAVWAAQARILLPWIEQQREMVQRRAVGRLGRERFAAALEQLFTPPMTEDTLEVGQLARIVEHRLGNVDQPLRTATHRLKWARNQLAHMTPLTLAAMTETVFGCAVLTP